MNKLTALALAVATAAFASTAASADSGNPMRDRVRQQEQRVLERALGPNYSAVPTPAPSIVGGVQSPNGKWPFQVGLLTANISDNFQAQFCGGTLVARQFVITAAHCITENNGTITLKGTMQVLTGTQNLANGGVRHTIAQVRRHPSYNPNTFDFDIAVIKLTTPASGIKFFATILASVDENTLANPGKLATVTGWGNTQASGPSSFPTALREVQVPIVTRTNCNDGNSYDGSVTMRMICAGLTAGGKDSCQGDSGGPLTVKDAQGRYRILAGIVSWGDGCAQPNLYGIYSRVAFLGAWAKTTIAALGGPSL
jgi:secreted trypsin-like serine protease